MPKRPALTDSSFLAHVFSPKKNATPTGLRKAILKGLTGGRKPARLKAFNRMSSVNQELLKRSGQRDAYLRGETTLVEARRTLRPDAIALNVAKPVRQRQTPVKGGKMGGRRTALDRMIAQHLKATVRDAGKNVNDQTVDAEIVWLGDDADITMTRWGYPKIKYAGRKGSEYEYVDSEGTKHNPFWYH